MFFSLSGTNSMEHSPSWKASQVLN